jgi:hypothetical protein
MTLLSHPAISMALRIHGSSRSCVEGQELQDS